MNDSPSTDTSSPESSPPSGHIPSGHIMVTGAAGFIGFHLCRRLLAEGCTVTGIDNLNEYYDIRYKQDRLAILNEKYKSSFRFRKLDLADRDKMASLFAEESFDMVVNLAAQAGVRYSLQNPAAYADSNLSGFVHLLEGCRHSKVKHLIFASSSSVYGANTVMPFSVQHNVDHPVSLYAATKKSNELMAHTYAHLFGLPATGLRFFTVYGPWGRPDMALFLFTRAIIEGTPIKIFNHGKMQRDFTYIDDIIEGVVRVMARIPEGDPAWRADRPDPSSSYAPYKIYNIGNHQPVELMSFVELIEQALGKSAVKEYLDMQPGDVEATYADIDDLHRDTGFFPKTPLADGIQHFVDWYREYHQV